MQLFGPGTIAALRLLAAQTVAGRVFEPGAGPHSVTGILLAVVWVLEEASLYLQRRHDE
jgi:hypothetical protein